MCINLFLSPSLYLSPSLSLSGLLCGVQERKAVRRHAESYGVLRCAVVGNVGGEHY